MSTVWAAGSCLYGAVALESGSKVKGMVLSRPVVVVAAWVICSFASCGMRKVDVQPAPRMSTSTFFVCSRSMVDMFVFYIFSNRTWGGREDWCKVSELRRTGSLVAQ